ncbi:MAG: sigma-70 family RNA polymerase sigma factor [[Clostridium] cellulosi]
MSDERRKLVNDNLNLVYYVLNSMGITRQNPDYDDLFGAGCVGLCKAGIRWKKGRLSFSTFAYHLIRHEIINEMVSYSRAAKLSCVDENVRTAGAEKGFDEIETEIAFRQFCEKSKQLLSDSEAKVLKLSVEGKTCGQTAAILGLSASAVKKARKKAKEAFIEFLKDQKAERTEKPAKGGVLDGNN